jgi:hypothetical protein
LFTAVKKYYCFSQLSFNKSVTTQLLMENFAADPDWILYTTVEQVCFIKKLSGVF